MTVVECAPAQREGGQNVDVRGAGPEITRRMGLEAAIRAATTGEFGLRFVDTDDHTIAPLPGGRSDSEGLSESARARPATLGPEIRGGRVVS